MEMERITYSELLQEGKALLETAAVQEAEIDSWLLLEYVTGMDRSCYFLKSGETADEEEMTVYRKLVSQRAGHIPLQYLTGVQEFMGLPFWVNQDVLVPRQDTECLVETALEYVKGKKVLDLERTPGSMLRKRGFWLYCGFLSGFGAGKGMPCRRFIWESLGDGQKKCGAEQC